MKYNVYPMGLSMITRQMNHNKRDRNHPAAITRTLKEMGRMKMIQTMMCADFSGHVYAEELFWMNNGKHIIFPDSAQTIENLRRGKFRVEMTNGIKVPHESFVVAFPAGFMLAGFECPSVMVTAIRSENRYDRLFLPFIQECGVNPKEFGKPTHDHEFFLAINYFMKRDNGGISRMCLPWAKLAAVLSCKNGEEYHSVIGSFDKIKDIPLAYEIPADEQELQFQLINLLARMFVYIQADGSSLVEGFPSTKAQKDIALSTQMALNKTPTAHTFGIHQHHHSSSVAAHYRSFHIRQLRDEKFYQGEWKNYPRGSRFVFVKDTFVNQRDVTPETLVGEEAI